MFNLFQHIFLNTQFSLFLHPHAQSISCTDVTECNALVSGTKKTLSKVKESCEKKNANADVKIKIKKNWKRVGSSG